MKKTSLKIMAMAFLFVALGCQENDVQEDATVELQKFIENNDLIILDEGSPTVASFESLDEARAYIDEMRAIMKKGGHFHDDNVFPIESNGNAGTTSRTPTVRQGLKNLVLQSSWLNLGARIEADIRYAYCTGNGNIVNDASKFSATSYLAGASIGLSWTPTTQISQYRTNRTVEYIIRGRLTLGFEYDGTPVGISETVTYSGFFASPQGNGSGEGACGNGPGGNEPHVHEGGCPPGHEIP
ncbi:hypothetical protein ACFQ1M_05350 [Sungkyunkwania multivorans]|uniref:Uncharacterized protein n=1 Tax=Sungkyunkwania multivorans TaxID=1173618 RepID=A0ABW3CX19_9FLAO